MGFLRRLLGRVNKRSIRLGIFGEVGAGKTTLANYITKKHLGKEVGSVTGIPHETRRVNTIENLILRIDGKELNFTIIDTPGLSTYIDYREFLKHGLSEEEAIERAKEATKGVIEAIKELDNVDAAIIVIDSTRLPFNQVNMMLIGTLELKKIPFVIAANKIDKPESRPELVKETFQKKVVVPISALTGQNVEQLLEKLTKQI
ncbi:MAG: Era-like GTP-binding protein [Candidatus Njordarchaeales archaeon]